MQTIPVLTVASDAKLAPATNDTSAFCAWQKVVAVMIAKKRTIDRFKIDPPRLMSTADFARAKDARSYELYSESQLIQKAMCPGALVT